MTRRRRQVSFALATVLHAACGQHPAAVVDSAGPATTVPVEGQPPAGEGSPDPAFQKPLNPPELVGAPPTPTTTTTAEPAAVPAPPTSAPEVEAVHSSVAPSGAGPMPATTPTVRPTQLAPVVHDDDVWWSLALCEDGGRNRDFGPYSGYFHFLPSTYHAYGGEGQPSGDDYATQLAVAQRLQSVEGWAPWPGCLAKLGLA